MGLNCLLPENWIDRHYLDYGPLLDKMRGKQWVLIPHVVRIEGDAAKVNLFKVPGGYVMPVTYGGKAERVKATLRKIDESIHMKPFFAYHPGMQTKTLLDIKVKDDELKLEVPLRRGCAAASKCLCLNRPQKFWKSGSDFV